METFDTYEEEYLQTSRRVTKLLTQLQTSNEVRTSLPLIAKTEGELTELKGYLKALDVSKKDINPDQKDSILRRLERYKRELKSNTSTFNALKEAAERHYLLDQNNTTGRGVESLNKAADYLDDSHRLLNETQDIGMNVMSKMEGQKESLLGAHDKVKETQLFTIEADKTLTIMGRRAISHKACLLFTIVLLLGLNILILYYGFIKK